MNQNPKIMEALTHPNYSGNWIVRWKESSVEHREFWSSFETAKARLLQLEQLGFKPVMSCLLDR